MWILCLLHLGELVISHAFTALEGKTKGPDRRTFGKLGNLLADRMKLCKTPIRKNFERIPSTLSKVDFNKIDMNGDQKTLVEYSMALSTGKNVFNFAFLDIGSFVFSKELSQMN